MSNLATTLASFDGVGDFNAKVLMDAGRFGSLQSAHNLMAREPKWYRQTRDLIARLPPDVQHAALVCFTDGMPHTVVPREGCDGTPPLKKGLRLIRLCADFTEAFVEALTSGGGVDEIEDVELERTLCDIERTVAQARESKNKRRLRAVG